MKEILALVVFVVLFLLFAPLFCERSINGTDITNCDSIGGGALEVLLNIDLALAWTIGLLAVVPLSFAVLTYVLIGRR